MSEAFRNPHTDLRDYRPTMDEPPKLTWLAWLFLLTAALIIFVFGVTVGSAL